MLYEPSKTLIGVLTASILSAGALFVTPSVAAASNGASASVAFVSGTEDLPLMAGLREVPERGVVFESARGRILEAWAVGYLTRDQIRRFYAGTLPQLGWRAVGDLTFHRAGEVLTLDFPTGSEDAMTVRFRIAPGP